MKIFILSFIACLPVLCRSVAGEAPKVPARAPAPLELRDQYDSPQRLAFPSANVVVLTIADKTGSEQIDGWVTALKARYGGRIELRGLADVAGVPGFLRGMVRKRFQETCPYPVMMDWSGNVCSQFGFQPGVANVFVMGRDGAIQMSFAGSAREPALKRLYAAIDGALLNSAPHQTNSALQPSASLKP